VRVQVAHTHTTYKRLFAFTGDGCVVGASALVSKNVPPGETVVGVNKVVARTEEDEASATVYGNDYRMAVRGMDTSSWAMQWVP